MVVGCASNPVPLPDWDLAERDQTKEAADPLPLPDLCSVPWQPEDVECWSALDEYDIVAVGNTEIAAENAAASRAGDQSYDELLGAAKVQQELSQIRKDLLEQERRGRELDKWWYRGLIVLIGVGVAL
jgi:hypothetical protein